MQSTHQLDQEPNCKEVELHTKEASLHCGAIAAAQNLQTSSVTTALDYTLPDISTFRLNVIAVKSDS